MGLTFGEWVIGMVIVIGLLYLVEVMFRGE